MFFFKFSAKNENDNIFSVIIKRKKKNRQAISLKQNEQYQQLPQYVFKLEISIKHQTEVEPMETPN